MRVKLLKFIQIKLDVYTIELPSIREVKKIMKEIPDINVPFPLLFQEEWWTFELRGRRPDEVYLVQPDGKYCKPKDITEAKAVRPIIKFKNPGYFRQNKFIEYKIGDRLLIKDNLFVIIGKELNHFVAFCETAIGYSPYSNKKNAPDLYTSELFNFFNEWKQDVVSIEGNGASVIKGASKVEETTDMAFYTEYFMPPDDITAQETPFYNMPQCPFWLYGRADEFSGQCFDKGTISNKSLSAKINVCPCLFAATGTNLFTNHDELFFMFKGYLFRIISTDKAICLNSIGVSCYSTGINTIGTDNDENAFYGEAEICNVIRKWLIKIGEM